MRLPNPRDLLPPLPPLPFSQGDNELPIQEWYTVATSIPEQRLGQFAIVKRPIEAGTSLEMHNVFGYDSCTFLTDATITVLYEGGRDPVSDPAGVWMSDSPFEYFGMTQLVARVLANTTHRVLIGGLGLGILANLLARRTDIDAIMVVELSPEVIALVGPHVDGKVRVIHGDFLEAMHDAERGGEQFDTVVADIFKTGGPEEDELFEDVRLTMDDTYPDAEHLFWAFQHEYEEDKIRHWAVFKRLGY